MSFVINKFSIYVANLYPLYVVATLVLPGIKEYLLKMAGCNKPCALRNIATLFLKWAWNMNNWVYVLFGFTSNYKYRKHAR